MCVPAADGEPGEPAEAKHDSGRDVWTGIWPRAAEAHQYGVDLSTLTSVGTWDAVSARWYLEDAPNDPGGRG